MRQVCGEDVPRGKPAPDAFLLAASKLGMDPQHCVGYEGTCARLLKSNLLCGSQAFIPTLGLVAVIISCEAVFICVGLGHVLNFNTACVICHAMICCFSTEVSAV